MFGMQVNKNSADKHVMKMTEHPPSSSDPQCMASQALQKSEEAQMVIRGTIALPLDESSNFIKCEKQQDQR